MFKYIINGIFILLGFIAYYLSKIYRVSLSKYKTYTVRKYNKGVLFIGCKAYLKNIKNIIIGNNSYINGGFIYAARDSKIIIGDNVMIADNVTIRTDKHIFSDVDIPMIKQGISTKDIIIDDDAWICEGATVLPGIKIGHGAIVGAKSIVTKDVPCFAIVAGIPAKILRYRK